MALNRTAIRSASSFFLVTFSTAFLFTLGARLTGWFTRPPEADGQDGRVGIHAIGALTTKERLPRVRRG